MGKADPAWEGGVRHWQKNPPQREPMEDFDRWNPADLKGDSRLA